MKNVDLFIRAYDEASDLQTLSAIWFDASLRAHPFIGEERLREQRIMVETIYLPKAETWVACHQGEPVGFISLLETFIGGLFVAPERQGLGAGRALVGHAFALKGNFRWKSIPRTIRPAVSMGASVSRRSRAGRWMMRACPSRMPICG